MNTYCADLHIHTVLSPCGDLDMSPAQIIHEATRKGLDIIAITDHNHTGNCKLTRSLGEEKGIWVVYGAEVTSKEDVHCLTFFDTDQQLDEFQDYIERMSLSIANDQSIFGEQLIVDRHGNIIDEISWSLYPGLNSGVEQIAKEVKRLGGYFVPAHIDRYLHGLYSQLGFFPEELEVDAVEIYRGTERSTILEIREELKVHQLLKSSDAHFLEDIGRCMSHLVMRDKSFEELGKALRGQDGRMVKS